MVRRKQPGSDLEDEVGSIVCEDPLAVRQRKISASGTMAETVAFGSARVNLSTPECAVHHLMLHLPVVVAMPHQSQGGPLGLVSRASTAIRVSVAPLRAQQVVGAVQSMRPGDTAVVIVATLISA